MVSEQPECRKSFHCLGFNGATKGRFGQVTGRVKPWRPDVRNKKEAPAETSASLFKTSEERARCLATWSGLVLNRTTNWIRDMIRVADNSLWRHLRWRTGAQRLRFFGRDYPVSRAKMHCRPFKLPGIASASLLLSALRSPLRLHLIAAAHGLLRHLLRRTRLHLHLLLGHSLGRLLHHALWWLLRHPLRRDWVADGLRRRAKRVLSLTSDDLLRRSVTIRDVVGRVLWLWIVFDGLHALGHLRGGLRHTTIGLGNRRWTKLGASRCRGGGVLNRCGVGGHLSNFRRRLSGLLGSALGEQRSPSWGVLLGTHVTHDLRRVTTRRQSLRPHDLVAVRMRLRIHVWRLAGATWRIGTNPVRAVVARLTVRIAGAPIAPVPFSAAPRATELTTPRFARAAVGATAIVPAAVIARTAIIARRARFFAAAAPAAATAWSAGFPSQPVGSRTAAARIGCDKTGQARAQQ